MTYPHTAAIRGLADDEGGGSSYQDKGTSPCFLQPLSDQEQAQFGSVYSQAHRCYFPLGTNINTSDTVEIDGVEFTVRGVSRHNYGSLRHTRALLEKK